MSNTFETDASTAVWRSAEAESIEIVSSDGDVEFLRTLFEHGSGVETLCTRDDFIAAEFDIEGVGVAWTAGIRVGVEGTCIQWELERREREGVCVCVWKENEVRRCVQDGSDRVRFIKDENGRESKEESNKRQQGSRYQCDTSP